VERNGFSQLPHQLTLRGNIVEAF